MSQPRLLAEFVDEFHKELARLSAASVEANGVAEKSLVMLRLRIDRIVGAIADRHSESSKGAAPPGG
ncbi:MAG: hypothetical protein ACRED5_12940 [Propylenella sp.]